MRVMKDERLMKHMVEIMVHGVKKLLTRPFPTEHTRHAYDGTTTCPCKLRNTSSQEE